MESEYTRLLELIEGEIEGLLPECPQGPWLRRFFGDLPYLPGPEASLALNRPARDLIARGGKRWRPLLLVLAARAFGNEAGALALSPLVELAHSGSLIVDDIEDGSERRRGGPAIHLIHGVDAAINDANLLYFLPVRLIDEFPGSHELRLALHEGYARNMRRLHLGQAMDIEWHRRDDFVPSREEYLAMCSLKTGVLARAAAELGSLAGGAGPEAAGALGQAFEKVGVAFQILDDAKNLREGLPGKARGDDIVEGKKSLPVILACARKPDLRPELARCFAAARAGGIGVPQVEEAIGLLEGAGAVSESLDQARALLEASKAGLGALVPNPKGLEGLLGLFDLLDPPMARVAGRA